MGWGDFLNKYICPENGWNKIKKWPQSMVEINIVVKKEFEITILYDLIIEINISTLFCCEKIKLYISFVK